MVSTKQGLGGIFSLFELNFSLYRQVLLCNVSFL